MLNGVYVKVRYMFIIWKGFGFGIFWFDLYDLRDDVFLLIIIVGDMLDNLDFDVLKIYIIVKMVNFYIMVLWLINFYYGFI